MKLRELFQPEKILPLTWNTESGHVQAWADDRQGEQLDIDFFNIAPGAVEIDFMRGGRNRVTGGGDAVLILNTVVQAVKEYLAKHPVNHVVFSAKEASRAKLYHRMAIRIGTDMGFRIMGKHEPMPAALGSLGNPRHTVFVLTNLPPLQDQPDSDTHTHMDENLQELTFHGSTCTKDCSGHRAGYKWSMDRGGIMDPDSASQSFVNGSNIAVRLGQEYRARRAQGGGRMPGYTSQTAQAIRKREVRAQAKKLNTPGNHPAPDQDNPQV
jgi:hypothetical protein